MYNVLYRACFCFCLLFVVTLGFKSFQHKIPNGDSVPHPCKPNYLWHGVGHENELGGGSRNPFGRDFDAAGKSWTVELCRKDSDGDGRTNGEELGDPNCIWRENAIPDKNAFSHPGVCEPYDSDLCRSKNTWVQCQKAELKCDAIDSPDVKNFTIRYPVTSVPSQETNYFCMTFELPQDGDYHMIATKPVIDNEYVMHHILLFGCGESVTKADTVPSSCGMGQSGCQTLIGAWAVGANGECSHKDVGFRIGQNGFKYAMMQFHWNNYERRSDYKDSSGMTLYYTPNRRPNDAGIMMIGQTFLEIPPRKEHVEATSVCTAADTWMILKGPVYVTRALNHMHYLGREQYIDLYRNGAKVTTLTNEPDYSYDRPRFIEFEESIQIFPGDEIRTRCVFKSTTKSVTTFQGDGTSDEMCFGFLTVHPLSNARSLHCSSWKNASMVSLFRSSDGCDWRVFGNASHPDMAPLYQGVYMHCRPLGQCLEECKEAVKRFRSHPCMTGTRGEYVMWEASDSETFEELSFYSKVRSCDLEILREQLLTQTTNGDDTNVGARVLPELSALLVAALLALFL
ncbi:DBH-like monooxygenase protein 2 homolog isoform X1 [Crassostrea angulata]|uniref:DBH-like monooxygenase protein 2 homolog isoform X1 n=1 Tax=Magallana angulata TaxID=2784310 RepID=UPI0022B14B14|nr:DBH-like monooxygenase protein 2 homolog isoform X1 [Crassostrea angulata]